MPYVDPNTVHNPATGTVAPAAWGDTIRDDLEFLIDPPACSVFNSSSVVVASATSAFLAANSENFDNDAMHSTVSLTSRITGQTAGRYLFTVSLQYSDPGGATGNRWASLRVNGTTTFENMLVPAAVGNSTIVTATKHLVLAAGDFVEARAFHTQGANLNVTLLEFAALFLTR